MLEKIKNNKSYVIIISILIIYVLIMIIIGKSKLFEKKDYYVVMNNNVIWKYNDEWNVITKEKEKEEILEKTQFTIHYENKKIENYYLDYDIIWKAHDSQFHLVNIKNNFFAYSQGFEINMVDIKYQQMSSQDEEIIKPYLNKKGLNNYGNLTTKEKLIYDINNDGKQETVYIISNNILGDNIATTEKFFHMVILKENNNLTTLAESIVNSKYDLKVYKVEAIIDYDNNKKYEIILNKKYYSQNGTPCSELINLYGDYKKIISCD